MTKKIANYEAPRLTVVEFRTERGYASSFPGVSGKIQMYADALQQEMDLVDHDGHGNLVGGYMDGPAEDNSNPFGGSGWEFQNGSYF